MSEVNKEQSKGLSIASMVLGIVSLVFYCFWFVSVPGAILAIIFGFIGMKRAGRGMAIAGLVLGIVTLVVLAVTMMAAGAIVDEIGTELNSLQRELEAL